MVFVLVGLVFYIVLGGRRLRRRDLADARRHPAAAGRRIRDLAHDVMAPVWEANHVWLIFVLTVTWTAYPGAFGSIASTLSIALFLAGAGPIVRGAAYALRSGTRDRRGGAAHRRRLRDLVDPDAVRARRARSAASPPAECRTATPAATWSSSWLNPTSVSSGRWRSRSAAYLAAVYLCADARAPRRAPTSSAPCAGARWAPARSPARWPLAGLVVLHDDAHPLYRGLVAGDGLPAVIVSVLAGVAAARARARAGASSPRATPPALAVAAISRSPRRGGRTRSGSSRCRRSW